MASASNEDLKKNEKFKKTFTLDHNQIEKLKALAQSTKIPQSVLVREALDYLFDRRRRDFR